MSTRSDRRSTSNSNTRGSSYQRRAHREWLVQEFRADVSIIRVMPPLDDDILLHPLNRQLFDLWVRRLNGAPDPNDPYAGLPYELVPACRCYRCGKLLTADEVSPDRWPIAGVDGGRYVRGNTRPSCEGCNTSTGSALGHARKAAKRAAKAARAVRVVLEPGMTWRSYPGVRFRHVTPDSGDPTPCGIVDTTHWRKDRSKTRCPSCVEASA